MSKAQYHLPWYRFVRNPILIVIIPEVYKNNWCGLYVPAEDSNKDPDLKIPQGSFNICGDMTIQTDFDRAFDVYNTGLVRIGLQGWGIVFPTPYLTSYWADKQILITRNSSSSKGINQEQSLAMLNTLSLQLTSFNWQTFVQFDLPCQNLYLMPADEHGANPNIPAKEILKFNLEPGQYRLKTHYATSQDLTLYHFEKL